MKALTLFIATSLLLTSNSFSQRCIDPAQIDPAVQCGFIYDPVCGCNGVTYDNQCEAQFHGGVTSWTPGGCQMPPPCAASFAWRLDSAGYGVQFVNSSFGTDLKYGWDFGDSSSSLQQDPYHVYNPAGGEIYYACLTIIDSVTGCYGTYCDYVFLSRSCKDSSLIDMNHMCPLAYMPVCGCDSVTYGNTCEAIYYGGVTSWTPGECFPQPPTCYAYFSNNSDPSDPLTVYFYGSSFGISVSQTWDFGDSTTSNDESPVHSYSSSGIYHVCYTVSDSTINCVQSYCQDIYVGSSTCVDSSIIDTTAPCPDIYDPVCGCDGNTYPSACDALYGAGITSYYSGECWMEKCEAWFWYSQDSGLLNVQFYDYSSGTNPATNWLWDFGDSTTSTEQNPFHVYTDTSQDWFYVCLTIYDSLQECYSTYCDYVYTDSSVIITPDNCYAYFGYTYDSSLTNVQFTDYSWGNPSSWSWDLGDGTTSTQQNPYHVFTDTSQKQFLVCLAISDTLTNCYNTYCDYIYTDSTLFNPCNARFGWGTDSVTGGVVFADSGHADPANYSYQWDFGDGATSSDPNPQHHYPADGYYWTCLTVYSPDSCIDIYCDSIYALADVVSIHEKPRTTLHLEVYPNPLINEAVIRYYLPSATTVSINVLDILGRRTNLISQESQERGVHNFTWNTGLREGIYMVELIAGKKREIFRVSVRG